MTITGHNGTLDGAGEIWWERWLDTRCEAFGDPLTMKCSDVRDTEVSHDEPVVREAMDKIFVSLRDLAMPL